MRVVAAILDECATKTGNAAKPFACLERKEKKATGNYLLLPLISKNANWFHDSLDVSEMKMFSVKVGG